VLAARCEHPCRNTVANPLVPEDATEEKWSVLFHVTGENYPKVCLIFDARIVWLPCKLLWLRKTTVSDYRKVVDNHMYCGKKVKETAPDDGSKELTECFPTVPAKNSNSFPDKS